jgi:FtsP/CotA-like multicopper oxidase with cupredoxin domain
MNNGKETNGLSNHTSNRAADGRAEQTTSWRGLVVKAFGAAAVVAAAAVGAHSLLLRTPAARAQMGDQPLLLSPQPGSSPFANPPEMASSAGRLRGVMQIISGEYLIPGVGRQTLRQYRGSPVQPAPTPIPAGTTPGVSPGPTLRARLGDQVQIAFLNKADRNMFPYTFVTDSKPGYSDFGCDRVGTRDPRTGKYIYPANDKYPNCFHGSNTANIHYHGTHTSPDGLGDNVLVQVLPDLKQPDWTATFNQIFAIKKIPQNITWGDLPLSFRNAQINLVKKQDQAEAADAIKNGLPTPEPMSPKNQELIDAGRWPQYFIGAFPNFFDLPDYDSGKHKAGQAPGTHWYHAHKHGSTSLHIRHGLAGAFVIESSKDGGYDHFIRGFYGWGDKYDESEEKIFVVQQYDPTQNLERTPSTTPFAPPPNVGQGSKVMLVNGQLTPTITMRPGEVQLWRFVNATEGNFAGIINAGTTDSGDSGLFQAAKFKFRQTAQDGVQFSSTNYAAQPYLKGVVSKQGLVLAAGNRADLLVQAPTTTGPVPFKSGAATLFFVNVTGAPVSLPKAFPDAWAQLPKFLNDLPKPAPEESKNKVRFQWEPERSKPGRNAAGNPPHFMINDKQFAQDGEDKVDQCMPIDGLQEWTLENYTSLVAHPFHIHINPFQVIRIETPTDKDKYTTYAPTDNFIWQDVIAVPPAVIKTDDSGKVTSVTPGRVTIRQTYLDFPGTFVLHCHILAHEDRGMMQLVRVVPSANYPKDCQVGVPDHH